MSERLPQRHASPKLPLILASLLLPGLASLAWRLHGWAPRAGAFGEAPASARGGAGRQAAGTEPAQPGWGDSDRDGIPDAAELRSFADRENFRRWFTAIAEVQFYLPSDEWNGEQRDCAGLIRFAWREALRPHDRKWFQKMGPAYEAFAPDVAAYSLDRGTLGERLFRTRAGAFRESDLRDKIFSEFADARTLKEFNCVFVGRDRRRARPGDLLFFHQPWARKLPYHVMLFLGEARVAPEGATDWVVYHTGASATDPGTVKKVRLAVLDRHPDARWRPNERNPNFLGFYRPKILD